MGSGKVRGMSRRFKSRPLMEKKFFWVFCAVASLSFGQPIPVRESEDLEILGEETFKVEPRIFENKILEAINKLRDLFRYGDPSSGSPPLDPFFLSSQDFDFYIMDTELKGSFRNTTFADFGRFEVEKIEFKLLPLHFKLDLFLDRFRIDGTYKMTGKILNEIPVNGTGKFLSETENLTLSLYLRPTTLNSFLQIKDLIVEFKTLGEKITYTNELVDDEVHVLDENLALHILDQVQEKYVPHLLNMLKLVLNHFLLGYSLADILRIILHFLTRN